MHKTKVQVPDGTSGDWTVSTFRVSKGDTKLAAIRAIMSGRGVLEPGTYKKLTYRGNIVMSDTPDEIQDQIGFVFMATGNVLINGLGLGITLQLVLEKKEVRHVTVIEKSEDVIKLVSPAFRLDPRVTMIMADALEYKPPKGNYFDAVWHDVWPEISCENLADMHKLHRKYGRICAWQGSWCRTRCERLAERDKVFQRVF